MFSICNPVTAWPSLPSPVHLRPVADLPVRASSFVRRTAAVGANQAQTVTPRDNRRVYDGATRVGSPPRRPRRGPLAGGHGVPPRLCPRRGRGWPKAVTRLAATRIPTPYCTVAGQAGGGGGLRRVGYLPPALRPPLASPPPAFDRPWELPPILLGGRLGGPGGGRDGRPRQLSEVDGGWGGVIARGGRGGGRGRRGDRRGRRPGPALPSRTAGGDHHLGSMAGE